MPIATVTSKGQITIPLPVRIALGLHTGCKIEFVETMKGRYEIIAAAEPVESLKGILAQPEKKVRIEDMNDAIEKCGAGIL